MRPDKPDKPIQVRLWDEEKGQATVTSYGKMGEVSDGYHTINELYRYRMLYNAAFFNALYAEYSERDTAIGPIVKSRKHSDGELCFGGGWFIVVANLPTGQISNHYRDEYWDLFKVLEVEQAPEYDGHTPAVAADRLEKYLTGDWSQ